MRTDSVLQIDPHSYPFVCLMFHGLYPCKLSDRVPHTLRDRDQLGIGLAATNRITQFHWLKHMIRYRQMEMIHFKLCISEARRQGKAPWDWCSSRCSSSSTNSSVFKAPSLFSLCHPWCIGLWLQDGSASPNNWQTGRSRKGKEVKTGLCQPKPPFSIKKAKAPLESHPVSTL